jgi:integrase
MTSANKLTNAFIKTADVGKHLDGAGLFFRKRKTGSADWVLRFRLNGKRHEMGLGGYPNLSLKLARELRDQHLKKAKEGIDPRVARNHIIQENSKPGNTFEQVLYEAFEAKKPTLKNGGKAGRWLSPIKKHVIPKIGQLDITSISQRDVANCLQPIWHVHPDVARKCINRINITIRHAAAAGLDVDLGLTLKAKTLLGDQNHEEKPLPSMLYTDIPDFYQSLADPTHTHLALRLLILTNSRVGPVTKINLDQIDGDIWTIPKEIMKGEVKRAEAFSIPLSQEALNVIDILKPFARDGNLFPSSGKHPVMSINTPRQYMVRRGLSARPGGFRATMKTWMMEGSIGSDHIQETIMSHKVGNSVSRRYTRTELIEQRRPIMELWANFVTGTETENVIEFRHG